MPSDLISRVVHAITMTGLSPGDEFLVGLSGGKDSMTLVHLLGTLHEQGNGPRPVAVHVDHRLRPDSTRDAERVAGIAGRFGLPVEIVDADVEAWNRVLAQGTEAAARAARYAAFGRVAARRGVEWLVLGHIQDDQAETVLLRLWRGTSLDGMAGMRQVSERSVSLTPGGEQRVQLHVLRPLLDTSRTEIEAYLSDHGLQVVDDPSNASLQFRRNIIRHQVLPVLEKESPGAKTSIARTLELLRDDADFINSVVDDVCPDVLDDHADLILVRRQAFRHYPAAIGRRVLARAIYGLAGDQAQPTRERIEALRDLVEMGTVSSRLEIGSGLIAIADYDAVAIGPGPGEAIEARLRALSGVPLLAPGSVIEHSGRLDLPLGNGWNLRVTAASGTAQIVVRTRRPGDRFERRPGEHVRLQDVLVNRKMPSYARDWLPLVVTGSVVRWIGGVSAPEMRIAPDEIHVELKRSDRP